MPMWGWGARAAAAIAAAALALLAAGCSPEKQIDTNRAEDDIKTTISAQTGDPVRSVRCPDEVVAKKGERFRCTATVSDGSRLGVVVTQTNDDGGVRFRIAGTR
jgi:Domain of unknown function (DUF4333)